MKYYLIAGEPSGDLHGSRLISALKEEDPQSEFRAWGGDLMQKSGAVLAKHIRDLAIMGIVQVLRRLPTIFRNFRFCHADIEAFKPDVIILIDYSGFNLRIAKWAKEKGFSVFYFISPQVWATRAGRVKKIKKYVDRMFVILPFEEDFYKKYNYKVDFIGHPLLDNVAEHEKDAAFVQKMGTEKPIIALLPGSRRQEVKSILSEMLKMVPKFPEYQFIIAGAPTLPEEFYRPFLQKYPQVQLVQGQTYNLLANAEAALVTSGTATLETALFDVPEVVCYKTGPLFYWIVKQIIKIPFISLVNIIMGRKIVAELIQHELNEDNLDLELKKILNSEHREILRKDYADLRNKLGNRGAAKRAAKLIVEEIKANVKLKK
jgi:lipid-A-disaccharide synthase